MALLVFLFSNCWYHPSEIFDYSSNSHIKAYQSDRSVPFNEILKTADQFYPSGNGKNFKLRSGRNPLWLQMKLKYFDQNISEDFCKKLRDNGNEVQGYPAQTCWRF